MSFSGIIQSAHRVFASCRQFSAEIIRRDPTFELLHSAALHRAVQKLATSLTFSQIRRRVNPYSCLLLLPLVLCPSVFAATNDGDDISAHYRFINIAPETLESKGAQRAIVQDGQGYMWFGSFDGLLRYDGIDFTQFSHSNDDPDSLSSSNVKALTVDNNGTLWIGTMSGLNRYNPATESFTRFINPLPEPLGSKVNEISSLAVTDDGIVWIGSFTGGLSSFDPKTGHYEQFRHEEGNPNSLPSDSIFSLMNEPGKGLWIGTVMSSVTYFDFAAKDFTHYSLNDVEAQFVSHRGADKMAKDLQGNLWAATQAGIVRLDPRTSRSRRYVAEFKKDNLISSSFFDVKVDSQGNVWAASEGGGIALYRPETDSFINFLNNPASKTSLQSNKVWAIFISKNDDLWFSHFPHGVSMLDPYAKAFKNYTTNSGALTLSHNEVLSIVEDENKTLWTGTEDGLTQIDFATNQTRHIKFEANNPKSIPARAVTSLLLDSKGILWIGTWAGGACLFDRKTYQCTQLDGGPPELANAKITKIIEDSTGDVWMAASGGLFHFDRETQQIVQYKASTDDTTSLAGNYVSTVLENSQHNLWVGTEHGLDLFNPHSKTFIHHKQADNNPRSLGGDLVRTLMEDSKGNIWIGSWSGGLSRYHRDSKDFTVYKIKNGLPNDSVVGIVEDNQGDIWLSTNDGLSQFNPERGTFANYGKEHGLAGTSFKRGSTLRIRAGELFIGGTHGLTAFKPGNIYKNTAIPDIRLTNFYLFSHLVNFRDKDAPLQRPIGETELLTLNSSQFVFSIDFAALNYKMPSHNQYKYRLQGFEENWQEAGYRHSATYTNIDPGNYVFQVIGSNNDGVWNTQGTSIKIRILPPWWKTWWAYALYTCGCMGLLAWAFLYQQHKKSLIEAENRRVEEQNRKLIELDKLKDDFIANTSHELRTPLNGIIGLADSLVDGAAGDVSQAMSDNLKMISASGKRLACLVNDILDFSKLKNKSIQIHKRPVNLYETVRTVLNICAHDTTLTIINNIKPSLKAILADEERLQQILFNLVGNAIKFTHRGSITLDAEEIGDQLVIKVSDTGIGIPNTSLDKIFNSFEQLEDHRDRSYSGTGLGLAVTKQLVEAHGGIIRVESEENVGSCFSFNLATTDETAEPTTPKQTATSAPLQKLSDAAPTSSVNDLALVNSKNTEYIQETFSPYSASDNAQFKVLIVDDNPINRQVLINQLTLQNYRYDVANDGQSALKMIEEDSFDLILLDIMMPKMSGYEVCAKLRETHPMEDLPIIFLTAKNTIADLVSGFEVGANDFLTKPISIGELNSRVKTHLQLLNINRKLEQIVNQRTQEVNLAHHELKVLDEIVSVINHEIRIDRLLTVILNETASLFPGTSYVAYWKQDERSDCFNLIFADNEHKTTELAEAIVRREVEALFLPRERRIAEDIYLIPELNLSEEDQILFGLPKTKSLLSMAFTQQDVISGVLVLGSRDSDDTFKTMLTANYVRLKNHIDSALSKARLLEQLERQCEDLEQVGLTDPLTGLKNRRFLTKYIDHDISLLQRKYFNRLNTKRKSLTQELALPSEDDFIFFLMDIDHFKQTNDELGHVAGDRVLADIQQILEPIFRTSDYRIRWGGEEFLIVARFCDREHAAMKAEQLRSAMENFNFVIEEGRVIHKTCSIGYACYPFSKTEPKAFSWTQVISLADLALYAVKSSQRNGWLGLTNNSDLIDDVRFKTIIEDPTQAVLDGYISTSTNLPEIQWGHSRRSNA